MPLLRNIWIQNALLLGVLGFLAGAWFWPPAHPAYAAGGGWETDGIVAATASGGSKLLLIDTAKRNMCIYKVTGIGQFRLVGARSFKYDVEIKDSAGSDMEKKDGWTYFQARLNYETVMKAGSKP